MRALLLCAAALALGTSCAHQARVIEPPDVTRLNTAAAKAEHAVAAAKSAALAEGVATKAAVTAHTSETRILAELSPKLDYAFSIAPQEMKPIVADLQLRVVALNEAQMLTTGKLNDALTAQSSLATRLEEANAAINEEKVARGTLESAVSVIVADYNRAEQARAKDSKALVWYRLHWWGSWLALGAGALACIGFAILRFINRNR